VSKHDPVLLMMANRRADEIGVPGMPSRWEPAESKHREPGLVKHGSGAMHGTGGQKDHRKHDLVDYLRAIDRAVRPVVEELAPRPLVVAGVAYEADEFVALTTCPNVVSTIVPGSLS
jgi:hypothetical protein